MSIVPEEVWEKMRGILTHEEMLIRMQPTDTQFGPALRVEVPLILIGRFVWLVKSGALDKVAELSPIPHPDWCTGTESPGDDHRSETLPCSLPDDETRIGVRLTRRSETGLYRVMLDLDDAGTRRFVRTLEPHQAHAMLAAADHLERICLGLPADRQAVSEDHPHWCLAAERAGDPHRSETMSISIETDLLGIWMRLSRGRADRYGRAEDHAWIEVRDDGETQADLLEPHQLGLLRHALTRVTRWMEA